MNDNYEYNVLTNYINSKNAHQEREDSLERNLKAEQERQAKMIEERRS